MGFLENTAHVNCELDISVVIPVFNEEDCIEQLCSEIFLTFENLPYTWEIIAVDDGSTDSSYNQLLRVQRLESRLKIIRFTRNYGQTAAISAGFDSASGLVVITLDADMQNDPADIGMLMKKIDEGYDVVSGWRSKRKDKWLTRKLPSIAANRLISSMTGVYLHDYGCTLKAYNRDIAKNVRLYGEMHRFIPALASEFGAKVTEVKVNHRPRKHGKSKYTLSRTPRVLLDLLVVKFLLSYRTRPLQLFGKLAIVGFFASFSVLALALASKLFLGLDLTGYPMLTISMFLFVFAIQLLSTGLLGELVVRVYYEIQDKPIYNIVSKDNHIETKVKHSAHTEFERV